MWGWGNFLLCKAEGFEGLVLAVVRVVGGCGRGIVVWSDCICMCVGLWAYIVVR